MSDGAAPRPHARRRADDARQRRAVDPVRGRERRQKVVGRRLRRPRDGEVVRAVLRHRQRVDVLEGDAQIEGHDAEQIPPLDRHDFGGGVERRRFQGRPRHGARQQLSLIHI